MIPRFNLTKGTFLPLAHCTKTPQGRLFSDSFHESDEASQSPIPSKLKLELMKLFPTMFDCRMLELDDVNVINEIEFHQLYINLTIRCSSIGCERNYKFIKMQNVYHTKSFNIPKLSSHETISLCGMDKVFVSQLTRCPSMHLNISPPIISIVISSDRNDLEISSNCEVCSFNLNGSSAEWTDGLSHLGTIPPDSVSCENLNGAIYRHEELINTVRGVSQDNDVVGLRHSLRTIGSLCKILEHEAANCNESDDNLPQSVAMNIANTARATAALNNFNVDPVRHMAAFDIKLDKSSKVILNDFINSATDNVWFTKRDLIDICLKLLDEEAEFDESIFKIRAARSASDILVQAIVSFYEFAVSPTAAAASINLWRSGKPDNSLNLLQSRINNVLSSSGLCQFADQTNSLAELSHRLRLTYMGPGGVTSRSAELNLREIQRWYFSKVCPIESPEGQGIGLVNELAMGAVVDENGHIASPYSKTSNSAVSNQIVCLNHFQLKQFVMSPFWEQSSNYVACVVRDTPLLCQRDNVDLSLISGSQLFSISVNLIPFLHHNDPTRALMAANMYKQAVPLLNPSPPLVGTGYENAAMIATRHNVLATSDCYVVSTSSSEIVVYDTIAKINKTYNLPPVRRTNQDTCFRLRSVVKSGQLLKSGDAIAECQSSSGNEMSLGANLTVAFMCWGGFNYEDSVVLSEDVVARGLFQSLHIIEFSTEVLKTIYGNEILTNRIPSIDKARLTHLLPDGLIPIGTDVTCGDVLVGKITPTAETQFKFTGETVRILNIESTKNSSIYVPSNIENATVVDVSFDDESAEHQSKWIKTTDHIDLALKLRLIKQRFHQRIQKLCVLNFPSDEINWSNPIGTSFWQALNKLFESYNEDVKIATSEGASLEPIEENSSAIKLSPVVNDDWSDFQPDISNDVDEDDDEAPNEVSSGFVSNKTREDVVLATIKVKLLAYRSIQAGDKVSGRHGNKGVISRIVPREDMPYTKSGMPIDIILNPLGVPSRMNVGQILETQLGLIMSRWGREFIQELKFRSLSPNLTCSHEMLSSKLSEVLPNLDASNLNAKQAVEMAQQLTTGVPVSCPPFSRITEKRWNALRHRARITDVNFQVQLYDGLTGKPFDKKTTVGKIYIFKLNHMVEDKMYFRSTGPYSPLTQQPTKGKASKGGQRMGEMEVWALQGHGAAFNLKETSTLKSDDVTIRSKFSPEVIASKLRLNTTCGESFSLLLTELKSLCVDVILNKPANLET
ncbi:MAG: hypothetical protein ACTS4U_00215 [Candidatus Hodgkinia cicadicola]